MNKTIFINRWCQHIGEFKQVFIAAGYDSSDWTEFADEAIDIINDAADNLEKFDLLEEFDDE